MDGNEKDGSKRRADDVYSQSLRAGNRTYFFDVKSTKSNDLYLTITESKRRFNNDNGKFYYEKHKLFLYPEDFTDFCDHLNGTLDKIKELNGGKEVTPRSELESEQDTEHNHTKRENENHSNSEEEKSDSGSARQFSDVKFEDLGKE